MIKSSKPGKQATLPNTQKPAYIREFASGHYLSELAYTLAKQSSLPAETYALHHDGDYRQYYIHALPLERPLFGAVLLPTNRQDKEIKVIIRGTDKYDTRSILANFEPEGPAHRSYAPYRTRVVDRIRTAIDSHYGPNAKDIQIEIAGHSQGASLSQILLTDILTTRLETSHFDGVKSITLTGLNSPGVAHSVAEECAHALLAQKLKKPVKVKVNYGIVGGDPIQMLAPDMVLAALSKEIVTVQCVKINNNREGSWVDAINLHNGINFGDLYDIARTFINQIIDGNGSHANRYFFASQPETYGTINVENDHQFYTNKNQYTTEGRIETEQMLDEIFYKMDNLLKFTYPFRCIPYLPIQLYQQLCDTFLSKKPQP